MPVPVVSQLTPGRTTFSNAAATIVAGTNYLAQIGTMSASRIVTLPAASAFVAGEELVVADESGTVTATNTIVVTRAGSDTIDGATTLTISDAYGTVTLRSDGTSKWTMIDSVARNTRVTPSGEMVETNVQSALDTLFTRTANKYDLFTAPRTAVRLSDEFPNTGNVSSAIGELNWALAVSGAGGTVTLLSATDRTGLGRVLTATSSAVPDFVRINASGLSALEGAPVFRCEFWIRIPVLNDGAQDFLIVAGLADYSGGAGTGVFTDGFAFRYTSADTSWHCVTSDAGVSTGTDTDTGVAATTSWVRLRIECDGAGVVTYYIDDVQVAQHTGSTNFPDAGDQFAPELVIEKTAGTTARTVQIDYFALYWELAR